MCRNVISKIGVCLFLLISGLPSIAAADVLSKCTGLVAVSLPDGTRQTLHKGEVRADLPSQSIVEVMSGAVDIAPSEGILTGIAGDVVVLIRKGERVTLQVDETTLLAQVAVLSGTVDSVVLNTAILLTAGQEVTVRLDKATGITHIAALKGEVKTDTVGVGISIPEGARAEIYVNAETRMVHGTIVIPMPDGSVSIVKIESPVPLDVTIKLIEYEAAEEGLYLIEDEPAEPEQVEGSRFLPE